MARLGGRQRSIGTVVLIFCLVLLGLDFLPRNHGTPSIPIQENPGEQQQQQQQQQQHDQQKASDQQTEDRKNANEQANGGSSPNPNIGSPGKVSKAEPAVTVSSKTVVMGKLESEDTDWVGYLRDWQSAIYVVDLANDTVPSPTGLRTRMNKAKEAMPYLTYIVDHYPDFPDVVAFVHSHRNLLPAAWHTDARKHDAVNMLNDLKAEAIVRKGFANLRCSNEVGCPDEVQPWREPPDPEKHAEHAYPYMYADFFDLPMSEVREQIPVIASPCCAQFAVSKQQILKRPKSDYEHYMRYLEETQYDDDTSGRVMEYMWHIIFGRDAVFCPEPRECYCELYGFCQRKHW